MEKSLLYVSKSLLALPREEVEIGCIVAAARCRNKAMGVTGTLIATYHSFAQILEGERSAIDTLMNSIQCDPRHRDIVVHECWDIERRSFSNWTLAYSGPASCIALRLEPLLSDDASPLQVTQLVQLMVEFGRLRR